MATASDIDDMVALIESAYRGESSRTGWTTEADLFDGRRTGPDELVPLLDRQDTRLLVCEQAGELVACAKLEKSADTVFFGMFAVSPRQQNAGLGKLVLSRAEELAKQELGVSSMSMDVIVQREALIAWYERRGYARTGETSPFPYGDERFGIPLRDDLHFVRLQKPL